MSQHIRDAADFVIRGLPTDYPADLDGLHAREFLAELEKRNEDAVIEFVHEAISEAFLPQSYALLKAIQHCDDTLAGGIVRRIVENYAHLKIRDRQIEWQPADLDEEPGPPEEIVDDNRERALAVREVLR